ncbi:hypothetical protein B0H19DRAFT_1257314 [Mycena capillaripes]|nr:hypothetical protein B0H19DRAFT_1257314 [Mycena capillaripes]
MPQVFDGYTAILSERVSVDLYGMYRHNGGGLATADPERATWFVAASMDDSEFVKEWYRCDLRVVTEDIIFEMVNNDGKIYAPNFSLAVSELEEIVPASVVFDFEHPDFSPTNRVFREQTPPSPFTPGARFRRPPPAAEKSKRPREPEVIDLTMDEDDEDDFAAQKG